MNKIPSAKELLNTIYNDNYRSSYKTFYSDQCIEKAMIEFAKLHVTKALTSAHINMQLPIEDLDFTLNSYPLENIK